jgi:hypothetical protein
MRRILAITLLIAFGSPLVIPALASTNSQSNLPACCRRSGAHHCATMVRSGAQSGPAFNAPPCPVYPTHSTTPSQSAGCFRSPLAPRFESLRISTPLAFSQWASQRFIPSSNLKRGPPGLIA